MRLGILGAATDPQVLAVRQELSNLGVTCVVADPAGLEHGDSITHDGTRLTWNGDAFADVKAWYARGTVNPLPPTFHANDTYILFDDWFVDYMARRERMGLLLSWLIQLGYQGIPVVNPPEHGAAIQLKAFQLHAAQARGFAIPRTRTTTDPAVVRAFAQEVGEVLFKPSMGGGLAETLNDDGWKRLDRIRNAPVTFQERIRGDNVRVTVVGEDIVSAVKIPSSALDYRADPDYRAGATVYEHAPMTSAQADTCRALLRDVGLVVAGLDFVVTPDGTWVFLEANPAPIWLDIERKTGAPISRAVAEHLLLHAQAPELHQARMQQARRPSSFCRYAYPQDPSRRLPS